MRNTGAQEIKGGKNQGTQHLNIHDFVYICSPVVERSREVSGVRETAVLPLASICE